VKPQHHVQHQGFNRDVQLCSAAEIDVDSKLVAETEAAKDAVADAHDDAS